MIKVTFPTTTFGAVKDGSTFISGNTLFIKIPTVTDKPGNQYNCIKLAETTKLISLNDWDKVQLVDINITIGFNDDK